MRSAFLGKEAFLIHSKRTGIECCPRTCGPPAGSAGGAPATPRDANHSHDPTATSWPSTTPLTPLPGSCSTLPSFAVSAAAPEENQKGRYFRGLARVDQVGQENR